MAISNQVMNSPIQINEDVLEKVILGQDLSVLKPAEKVQYIGHLCKSLGLNPLTKPFEIMKFNGKEIPYARKDCTEQLRKIHNISITKLETKMMEGGIYVVTAFASKSDGRQDTSTGAVSVTGLKGEALSNAMLKAETKAKRRVTLSICGLGMLDESEVESMPGAQKNVPEKIEELRSIDQDIMDIAWAESIDHLQEIYTKSYKYWATLRDKEALEKLMKAKDKRKDELLEPEITIDDTGEVAS